MGDGYCEAASVCLSRHHEPPSDLVVDCEGNSSKCSAEWVAPDQQTKAAWANEIDATEAGAYGVSLAAIELAKGLVAVRRAETLTGADYYVAPLGTNADDLEACMRLEVSGTDKGNRAVIQQRLKAKISQATAAASNLPAIASVVGFRECAVVIAKMDDAL
ncbi:MAG: hypothetical protein HY323_17530 [Betaproteobacteria bacterium]|nr:hypothetical protein [Betaproteobacteria bacterium]